MGHPELAVCFLFVALVIGSVITYFAKAIPYTVVMFSIGILFSFLPLFMPNNALGESIAQWEGISPELLLFTFLPALLFGDAMHLKLHHIRATFSASVFLAGPCCVFGTFALALLCRSLLPYNFSFHLFLILGSILCATDPVAVVSLLKSLKASPNLTMLITQEALFNDGSALVLFNLFYQSLSKTRQSTSSMSIFIYFLRVIFISPLLGMALGFLTVIAFRILNRKANTDDITSQVALTFCCAYLSFFIGEYSVGVSGVLTCCFAGFVLSWVGYPLILAHHTMHNVWGTIEWVGNTVIFMLAGLLFGKQLNFVTSNDMWNILVVYLLLHIIRAIQVLFCLPLLPSFDKSDKSVYFTNRFLKAIFGNISSKDFGSIVFLTWGGLRGAVGITLGLYTFQSTLSGEITTSVEEGRKIFVLVGGVAFLTLIINATLSQWLLTKFHLVNETSKEVVFLQNYARKRIKRELYINTHNLINGYDEIVDMDIINELKRLALNEDVKAPRSSLHVDTPNNGNSKEKANEIFASIDSGIEINHRAKSQSELTIFEVPDSFSDSVGIRSRAASVATFYDAIIGGGGGGERGGPSALSSASLAASKIILPINRQARQNSDPRKLLGVDNYLSSPKYRFFRPEVPYNNDNNDSGADGTTKKSDSLHSLNGDTNPRNDKELDGLLAVSQRVPFASSNNDNDGRNSPFINMYDNDNFDGNYDNDTLETGVIGHTNIVPLTEANVTDFVRYDPESSPRFTSIKRNPSTNTNARLLLETRLVFVECLRSEYCHQIEEGKLRRESLVDIALLNSVDVTQDNVLESIEDWPSIEAFLDLKFPVFHFFFTFLDVICCSGKTYQERFDYWKQVNEVDILISYVEAHNRSQKSFLPLVGDTPECKRVIFESKKNVAKAMNILNEIDAGLKIRQLANQIDRCILRSKEVIIERMHEQGVIRQRDAEILLKEF